MKTQILADNTITQEDIHVYLSLRETIKQLKESIEDRLAQGGEVELGVHKAKLSTFDRNNVDRKHLEQFILVNHGRHLLDHVLEGATTTKSITRLFIR